MVGRIESSPLGEQVLQLDSIKQTVRLAAGLGEDGTLDAAARSRGLRAMAMFGERLRSFAPEAVRAVATSTVRAACNATQFLAAAEAALGFPIEVISGIEEARLIYQGAAHTLPCDGQPRLVFDIGGGSTECIVGTDLRSSALESAAVGCVALSKLHFVDGRVDRAAFERAYYTARAAFAAIGEPFARAGWRYAVGTSGTAKSLWQIAQAETGAHELGRDSLARIHAALLKAGHVDAVRLPGLQSDRRPVLAGGLAIMMAVFDEFGIESMRYCSGALRQGVLHDLLGRSEGNDTRALTVAQMLSRYGVDRRHAMRVRETALALFDMASAGCNEDLQICRQLLGWAAELAEVGRSISHEGFHKHSAYILGHADMAGFSQREQAALARLALAQTGGLRKMLALIDDDLGWLMVMALRVAIILHRKRDDQELALPGVRLHGRALRIEMPESWARRFPLTHDSLGAEAAAWCAIGVFESFDYGTT